MDVIFGPTLNFFSCLLLLMEVPKGRAQAPQVVSGTAYYLLSSLQIVLGIGLGTGRINELREIMFPFLVMFLLGVQRVKKFLEQNVPAVVFKVTYRNEQSKSMLKYILEMFLILHRQPKLVNIV